MTRPKDQDGVKDLAVNRQARHDYLIEETFEAGLVLVGTEVKSARSGRVQIKDAYGKVQNGEAWLIGLHIAPYTHAYRDNHEPERRRKILLHRHEIKRLIGKTERAGYTLVPLDLHYKRGRIKLEVGLAKGKKQHDKRATIREREWGREQQRLLRQRPGSTRAG